MRQLVQALLQQYRESIRSDSGCVFLAEEERVSHPNSTVVTITNNDEEEPLSGALSLRFEDLVMMNIRMRVLVLEHYLPNNELRIVAYCSSRLAVLAAASIRSSQCIELLHAVDKSQIVKYSRHVLGAVADYAEDGHAYPMAKAILSAGTQNNPETGERKASRIVIQQLVAAYPPSACTSYDFIDGYFDSVAVAVDETESSAAIDYAISAWLQLAVNVNRSLDERCLSICVVIDFSGFALYEKPERRFLLEALDALKELWDDRYFAALRARILRADDDDSLGWDDDDDDLDDDDNLLLDLIEENSFADTGLDPLGAPNEGQHEDSETDSEKRVSQQAQSRPIYSLPSQSEANPRQEENERDDDENDSNWEEDCFDEGLHVPPELDAFCPGPTAEVFASLCKTRVFMRMASLLLRIEEAQRKPKRRSSSQSLFLHDYPALPRVQAEPPTPNLSAQAEEEAADKVLSMVHELRRSLDRVFTTDDVRQSFVLSRHAELVRLYQLHVVGSDARAGLAKIVDIVQRDLPRFAALFFLLIDRTATRRNRGSLSSSSNPNGSTSSEFCATPDVLERISVRRGRDDGYMLRTYVALYHVCELCLHTSPRRISRQLKSANSVSAFLVGYKDVLDILPNLFRQADIYAALVRRACAQAQASINPSSIQKTDDPLPLSPVYHDPSFDHFVEDNESGHHSDDQADKIFDTTPTPLANNEGGLMKRRPSLNSLVDFSGGDSPSEEIFSSPMGLKKRPSLHDLIGQDAD